jgi:hypothetical protein
VDRALFRATRAGIKGSSLRVIGALKWVKVEESRVKINKSLVLRHILLSFFQGLNMSLS